MFKWLNNFMSKFKTVLQDAIKKSEDILEEMPQASKVTDFDLGVMYKKIHKELVHEDDFEMYKLMRSSGGEYVHDFLVDSSGQPVLYSSYKISEGFGIFGKSVYQDKAVKGLARRYYVHYLLPKYGVILSDSSMSNQGIKFYENMFDTVTMKVIDTSTKEVGALDSSEELYDYFGVGQDRYRFMITPKQ